jgi:uncharacterized protein YacL
LNDPSSVLPFLRIAIAIAAIVCSAALIRKAINFHADLRLGAVAFLVSTVLFTMMSVHIPLYFMSGSERIQHHLAADVIMFGASGLIVIAIIGFAIDHIKERPNWLMVAAAAVISMGIFPYLHEFSQESLNQRYDITIVQPDPTKISPEPLIDKTSSAAVSNDNSEKLLSSEILISK